MFDGKGDSTGLTNGSSLYIMKPCVVMVCFIRIMFIKVFSFPLRVYTLIHVCFYLIMFVTLISSYSLPLITVTTVMIGTN